MDISIQYIYNILLYLCHVDIVFTRYAYLNLQKKTYIDNDYEICDPKCFFASGYEAIP